MILENNNTCLDIKIYNTFFKRLMGLTFKRNINYGICLPRCKSIHTFFMKENIDVIMTDRNYNILYVYNNLSPNRIIFPKKEVYYTFELPTNKFKLNIKEKLNIKKL